MFIPKSNEGVVVSDMQLLDYAVLLAVCTLGSLIAIGLVVGGTLLWDLFREFQSFRRTMLREEPLSDPSRGMLASGQVSGSVAGARVSSSAPDFPPEV